MVALGVARVLNTLNSTYGVPVSIWDSMMANHSLWAEMVSRWRPSDSYRWYRSSNSLPQQSDKPGASLGQNRDQVPPDSTRCTRCHTDTHSVNGAPLSKDDRDVRPPPPPTRNQRTFMNKSGIHSA